MLPYAYLLTAVLVCGVPLSFAAAVYAAPTRLDSDERFTQTTLFLFQHYRRERYFSALLLLGRSFLLSLTAVMFPGSVIMQTSIYVCILSLSVVNTLLLLPYTSGTNNVLDATLCLLLMCSSLGIGRDVI